MGYPPSVIKQMSAADFDLMREYGEQEPFGPWRHNHDIAVMASALFNLNRGRNEARTPDAFMYKSARVYAAEEAAQGAARAAGHLDFLRAVAVPADPSRRGKPAPTVFLE